MANTYSYSCGLTVQNRECIMRNTWNDELYKKFEIDYDDRFVFKPVEIEYSVPDGT